MNDKKNIKKEAVKQEYYTVKLETMMPVTLTYQILAESPEKAIEKISAAPTSIAFKEAPKLLFARLKKVKLTVYNASSNIIRLIKNF